MRLSYDIGSTIVYTSGTRRVVLVDEKETDIKNGRPGFGGTVMDGPDKGMDVWGYDSQDRGGNQVTRVKVHPHRTMVNSGVEACVSITPARARARAYYMGTVMLKNVTFSIQEGGLKRAQSEQVRNVHALAVGDLIDEFPEQYEMTPAVMANMRQVTYHYNVGRFITTDDGTDVTDGFFDAAYFCGRDFYVSEF